MNPKFIRTEVLLGRNSISRLSGKRVAVFGLGGVGGHACDALARSGIGALDLVDMDVVSESNVNRQMVARLSTIGKYKTEVMRDHILDINPECVVRIYNCFFLPKNRHEFPFEEYDYIVDAIDTVSAKIALAEIAQELKIPIISCMGAGNKLDPTQFQVTDIYKTKVCPLARVMRTELKKRGIRKLKVVYSEEVPVSPSLEEWPELAKELEGTSRRSLPGSVSFVPSVAGLIAAGEVIKDLSQ